MGVVRARILCTAVAVVAGLVLAVRGQAPASRSLLQLENIGLPAIEGGAIWDVMREPGSAAAVRREARSTAQESTRTGTSGRSYTPGRVIVRFRDEVPQQDRLSVLRQASGTADLAVRQAYAD